MVKVLIDRYEFYKFIAGLSGIIDEIRIFINKDNSSNFIFYLTCDKKANSNRMFRLLNDIKNLFFEYFLGHIHASEELKSKLMESFNNAIKELVEPSDKFSSLFSPF